GLAYRLPGEESASCREICCIENHVLWPEVVIYLFYGFASEAQMDPTIEVDPFYFIFYLKKWRFLGSHFPGFCSLRFSKR
ncbi:hypothetical protein BHE74_00015321, partial [Ensete ventricosum]